MSKQSEQIHLELKQPDKQCDYPGCQELATIECCMIGCIHKVCETHGNCLYEVTPDETAPICWFCCGKGWGDL